MLELYRLWREEGIEAAIAHLSPKIEWIEPPEVIGGESRHGIEEALEGFRNWTHSYEDYGGDIAQIEDERDAVLVHFVQRGRLRGATNAVEEPAYHLWTVRDGRAVRMQIFFDLDAARAALHTAGR